MGISAALSVQGAHGSSVQYEEFLASRLTQYGGTILQGDDALSIFEFSEAADAVNCAIGLQEQFADYSRLGLDEGTIGAKVGIHFGEVSVEQGKFGGSGIETLRELMIRVPYGKIYLTREAYVRVRVHINLPFEQVREEGAPAATPGPALFSVDWKAVAGNLKASLRRLDEDDLQRMTTLSTKLGIEPSKRAAPIIMIFLLLFIYIVFKLLRWL